MNEIRYIFRFTEPAAHLADIEMRFPAAGAETEIWMPVWTPGSYLVREYSRNVQELSAADAAGQVLEAVKTAKNRWVVSTAGVDDVVVRYRVYGREKSVRTNWIDADYALLNGAPSFFTVDGMESTPHRVSVEPATGWEKVLCSLDTESSDGRQWWVAKDLDELIDSPFVVGNPTVYEYTVDGKSVALVNQGESGLWDGEKAARDTRVIVEAYRDLYGSLPFERYLFYNLIVEFGGGLEHKNSSVLMTSRYSFRNREKYADWLGLVSHEFFHVWNVKRSRPVELGPFDYQNEVYTRSLWVAEGFTAYYTDLMPRRAGLTTDEEYLKELDKLVNRLAAIPGRGHQSLEDSSFDAWIKLYRADENTANTTVSYYLKGALVTWLLDTEIRRRTGDQRTMDDLMRLLYESYSEDRGFTREQLQAAAEEVAGGSLEAFFDSHIRGTQELDYAPALETFGLRFKAPEDTTRVPWLGVTTKTTDNHLVVTHVRADGPARLAGLNAEDELLAVGGFRVTETTLQERLDQFAVDETVDLLVSRAGAVRTIPLVLAEKPREMALEFDPEADEATVARRTAWLGGK